MELLSRTISFCFVKRFSGTRTIISSSQLILHDSHERFYLTSCIGIPFIKRWEYDMMEFDPTCLLPTSRPIIVNKVKDCNGSHLSDNSNKNKLCIKSLLLSPNNKICLFNYQLSSILIILVINFENNVS